MADVAATISVVATAIGVAVGATSLAVSAINARRDQLAKRMEREAEVLQVMNARFQRMAAERRDLDDLTSRGEAIPPKDVYAFYAQYWALQIDQWEHYRLGVISPPVFAIWLCYLHDSLAGFHKIGGLDSRASWEQIGRSLSRNNVEFRLLTERLYDLAGELRASRQTRAQIDVDRLELRNQVMKILRETPLWLSGSKASRAHQRLLSLPIAPLQLGDRPQ